MAALSRRIFLKVSGSAALVPTATAAPAGPPPDTGHAAAPGASAASSAPVAWLFFNRDEAATVEAALLRLIPPDAVGPGALEAGCAFFIDRQLAGAWGAGERLYRSGPWDAGLPQQGYQLPFTPAELFRTALRGLRTLQQQRHAPLFEQLDGPAQDTLLTELQEGRHDLAGVPSKVFFESLWAMTLEGYFGDPVYGGNRDMAAWRMIGFPGAHAAFYDWVDRHGALFDGPPRSLAEHGGAVHVDPRIPATAPVPTRPAR